MSSPVLRIALALLAVLGVATASMLFGAASISPTSFWSALIGSATTDRTILLQLRLPRIVVGAGVGGSLAAAGVALQGLFRNPLAEPYVIGASSGAALGVAITVVMGLQISVWSLGASSVMAMLGSLTVVGLVMTIGAATRGASTTVLLLAGVIISSMASSIVTALLFWFDQKAVVILSWLMGSLAGSHWGAAIMVVVLGALSIGAISAMSRALDAFTLGDAAAQSLGLDLTRFRWGVILAASLATASSVAAAGVIGFVGLIAPHIARKLVGARHAVLIPMAVCVGAALMLLADIVARTIIAPAELPAGIVTAILGCPLFLWLLLRDRRPGSSMEAA